MEWLPIATALDSLGFRWVGPGPDRFKIYEPALVYGPVWMPVRPIYDDWPGEGRGAWAGPRRVAIASTCEGRGFWTIETDAPGDYETHIQPTHWMPVPDPPLIHGAAEREVA